MRKVKWAILFILISLVLSFCVYGGNFNKNKDKTIKVLLSDYDGEEKFPALIVDKIIKYSNKENIDIVYKDAKCSKENQLKDIKDASDMDYDAIICIPADGNFAGKVVKYNEKLPIVFVNNNPGEEILQEDKVVYVGAKEEQIATYQAEYILKYFSSKEKKEINVVIFKGKEGHDATIKRTKAVKEAFEQSRVKVNYVFEDTGNWLSDMSYEKFNVFLKTKQDFDCVICNNDAMAIGVAKCYNENNIDFDKYPIVGIDATKEGGESIINNEIKFTVYQSPEGEAEYAVEAVIALAKGKSISQIPYTDDKHKNIWIPCQKVDKSNAKDFYR